VPREATMIESPQSQSPHGQRSRAEKVRAGIKER
jgi:hypothetical protein